MSAPVRAISLHQPWASLIALGKKEYETRSWATKHRGPLAICAAKRWTGEQRRALMRIVGEDVSPHAAFWAGVLADPPLGAVVALVELADCIPQTLDLVRGLSPLELSVGGWEPGRFAWRLKNVRPLSEPLPIKGRQGLWTLTDEQAAEVERRSRHG